MNISRSYSDCFFNDGTVYRFHFFVPSIYRYLHEPFSLIFFKTDRSLDPKVYELATCCLVWENSDVIEETSIKNRLLQYELDGNRFLMDWWYTRPGILRGESVGMRIVYLFFYQEPSYVTDPLGENCLFTDIVEWTNAYHHMDYFMDATSDDVILLEESIYEDDGSESSLVNTCWSYYNPDIMFIDSDRYEEDD